MGRLGIKHLIECHCTLKIFKGKSNVEDHLYHKFPVYSQIQENGKILERIAQCNNCGTLHRVIDYCKSELVERGSDVNDTSLSTEDIEFQISEKLSRVLKKYKCDISTWEHVLDIVEKECWGENVVLTREVIDQIYHVKVLQIISEDKIKIMTKKINDEIT